MSLLKRLFSRGAQRSAEDASHALARELELACAEAERLVAAGRHDEAVQVAEAGLRRFPSAKRLRQVVQYVRRNAANKKLNQLKAQLEARKDERAYRELVTLYLELARNDAALETAQRYVEEFPDAADAHVALAEVQLARYYRELFARDGWAAIEALERALELDPEAIRAHLLLGMIYFTLGATRTSAAKLADVLHLDPGNSSASVFREELLARSGDDGEEDVEILLDQTEDSQQLANDPGPFPGGARFSVEGRGGTLQPKLFATAAAGIGKRLRLEQLAAVGTGGKPLAVAGENKESFVRLAARLDSASRRAGRHMNFGTMRRFMVEGPFGRVVLIPAGNCSVAARAPRSISTERIAEGLETVVTASRDQGEEER